MFKEDAFEGQGLMKYVNGDQYKGEWKKGKKHGQGEFRGIDKRVIIGEWIEDEL